MNTFDRIDLLDISPDFCPNKYDQRVGLELIKLEGTPKGIEHFAKVCDRLTDYGYWFFLGTLWVSYTGWSDLQLWRRLFASNRPNRSTSLMKPSELAAYSILLPAEIRAFRAHRPGEVDWISYSLNPIEAAKFALRRGVDEVSEYLLQKQDVIALFLRRGEQEVIMLDPGRAQFVEKITVVRSGAKGRVGDG